MTWAEQDHRREMAGLPYPGPVSRIIRLPDPEDFAEGTLERQMATRLKELPADHPLKAEGVGVVRSLTELHDKGSDWLDEVGWPATPDDEWDDETDWRLGPW